MAAHLNREVVGTHAEPEYPSMVELGWYFATTEIVAMFLLIEPPILVTYPSC